MKQKTGLDYSDSDMSMGQIYNFIHQVKRLSYQPVIHTLFITGGEPLLHANVEEITSVLEQELLDQGYILNLYINSNTVIKPRKSLEKFIINFSTPENKPDKHNVTLLHPVDFHGTRYTYETCSHYRKQIVVLSYQGYSLCCAGDAYIRLFAFEDLLLEELPRDVTGFPIKAMDKLCMHCPYGHDHPFNSLLPFERDAGCPVSQIYAREAMLNQAGRKINKRFGERSIKTT